jgi:hypothetical protein
MYRTRVGSEGYTIAGHDGQGGKVLFLRVISGENG